MTKKILCVILLVCVFLSGSFSGFIAGVEFEKESVQRRSVKLPNCLVTFQ